MIEQERPRFVWMDLLWLACLGGIALQPPRLEVHKQLTLAGIGFFQILEGRILAAIPASRARTYSVLIKVLLATLLLDHTGGIDSSYWLVYYLPVVTAAMYFDAWGTLFWTAFTSAIYCSLLIPALFEYYLDPESFEELAIRILFFFPVAVVVNRFMTENRRQSLRYRRLAEELAEANRRLAEAQEEARRSERLAALGQLSAGLAHELRNPLAVIKGSAETLTRKLQSTDPVTTEMTGFISSEVNRLNAIVTRFLNFARPLKVELRPEQIPPLVERALKAGHDRWPEAQVEVERQYGSNLPNANVDAELCEQVFTNLVLNAYEAMPGGGKLRVTVTPANSDGQRGVAVEVEDTGPGIPPELGQQIFNPFFTTKKDGVGLGLSIVSKIVDDHRGWIRVSPAQGKPAKGACFRVFLPVG